MARLSVPSRWERTILVCGKCSKRVGGGFGAKGRTRLAKALCEERDAGRKRKARVGVIEVKCLGLCPKAGVVVIDGAAPGEWRIVAPGTPIDEVAGALRLDQA